LIQFELAFLDSGNGALVSASAAGNADVSVDLVLAVALSDSGNGALISTSAAGDASISNLVSHDISSHKYCSQPRIDVAWFYSSTVFIKINSFFQKPPFNFSPPW
jgi:hypothetical protein